MKQFIKQIKCWLNGGHNLKFDHYFYVNNTIDKVMVYKCKCGKTKWEERNY
jgi:hypothetical protein